MIEKDALSHVNHKEIDTIHIEEVELLQELLESLDKEKEDSVLTKAFEGLISHMQEHFSFEEGLMQKYTYAMYSIHQAEHYKVLNEAKYRMLLWTSSKDRWDLKEYLDDDLVPWYGQHIDAMDKPMVEFLRQEGEI